MTVVRVGLMMVLAWGVQAWLPAAAAVVEGDPVPRVEIVTIDGATIAPEQHQGKVVLTVFWATWCHICLRELPEFQALHDEHHAAGLEIVALSVDTEVDDVREYLRRATLTYTVAMRTPELKSAWGPVQGTPLLFLSDRAGIVRMRHLGGADGAMLEREIRRLLAQ